jgi:3-hydroxybutyryl-CoA dehydrogenase
MSAERVGVVGAGTMGAGIAQLACLGGYETVVSDPDGEAIRTGMEQVLGELAKGAEKGRWSEEEAKAASERVQGTTELEELRGCELVIEAAPEKLELKRELFARLEAICGSEAVLATNTSSLSVTAIAAGTERPSRVVGMHFFNPPPVMKLVEIVAGEESSEQALIAATDVATRMDRTPIRARDGIGFVANRCVRPYNLEALRMLGEGLGTHEEIDRVYRLAGGFRMGPFELMDLIGVDVNLAVARSFFEQSFGEPRWRPHPIQARMVAAGRLGRKSGRGFYDYSSKPYREPDPEVEGEPPILDEPDLEQVAGQLGIQVIPRLAAAIANEAAFALQDGVASPEDIDTAMRLGFNWPIGPLELADLLGPARGVGILDELRELNGEAYRAAPLLRQAAASGEPLSPG